MNVLTALVTAIVVFVVAASAAHLLPQGLRDAQPWLPQALLKTLLVVASLGLMRTMRRPFAAFGFRRASRSSKRWIAAGVGLGALTTVVVLGLGLQGMQGVLEGYTFPMIVFWIWLVSSVSEEIFVRGWFQSAIAMGGVAQRTAVILSGAVFGAMHLSLLVYGVEPASVGVIVTATFLLGILCAWLRATRDSLVPAILAHIAFNVGGMIGGIVVVVARKMG